MGNSFLPAGDPALLAWSLNFTTLLNFNASSYGLTSGQATSYGTLHTSFSTSLAACDPAIRTRGAVQTKNTARLALKNSARSLAKIVEGTPTVTNAQKVTLGLNVRSLPSPIPAPSDAPNLDIVSRLGTTVKIKLHDGSGSRRGKPAGVQGVSVFSYAGATPPAEVTSWKFEGNTTRTVIDVAFPNTLTAGTIVWFTAFWYNPRGQSGPGCSPVSAILAGGGMAMAA